MNNCLLGFLIESGYCVPIGSDRSFLFNLNEYKSNKYTY